MKAIGTITIEEGLDIVNPTVEINSAFVEAIFTDENGFKHSRLMNVDLTSVNIPLAMASNDVLNQFKE
jgi:hypothetical protein